MTFPSLGKLSHCSLCRCWYNFGFLGTHIHKLVHHSHVIDSGNFWLIVISSIYEHNFFLTYWWTARSVLQRIQRRVSYHLVTISFWFFCYQWMDLFILRFLSHNGFSVYVKHVKNPGLCWVLLVALEPPFRPDMSTFFPILHSQMQHSYMLKLSSLDFSVIYIKFKICSKVHLSGITPACSFGIWVVLGNMRYGIRQWCRNCSIFPWIFLHGLVHKLRWFGHLHTYMFTICFGRSCGLYLPTLHQLSGSFLLLRNLYYSLYAFLAFKVLLLLLIFIVCFSFMFVDLTSHDIFAVLPSSLK